MPKQSHAQNNRTPVDTRVTHAIDATEVRPLCKIILYETPNDLSRHRASAINPSHKKNREKKPSSIICPHELSTTKTSAPAEYIIEFIPKSNNVRQKTTSP